MATTFETWRRLAPWGGVIALALLLGTIAPGTSSAGPDPEQVQVLVKCTREALPDVLRAVAAQGGEAWDLATMRRLLAPPPDAPATPAPIPAVRDAARAMEEVLTAVAALTAGTPAARLEVDELSVQELRLVLKCTAADPTAFDAVRRVLRENAWLKERALDAERLVELGAQQQMPGARWKQSFTLRFGPSQEPARRGPAGAPLPMAAIQAAALDGRMQLMYAGPERRDPNRAAGYETVSREFQMAPATFDAFASFLARVPTRAPGWTVSELRWKRADAKVRAEQGDDMLGKTVVTVATRLPLAD